MIEGLLVVAVLIIAMMGTQLPASLIAFRVGPDALAIALVWILGVWLIGRGNNGLPWHDSSGNAPDAQAQPKGHSQAKAEQQAAAKGRSTAHTALSFSSLRSSRWSQAWCWSAQATVLPTISA